jgi:Fic family protein
MKYAWQQSNWTNFRFDLSKIEASLLAFSEESGMTSGILEGLSEGLQAEAITDLMISEALKTSEIEGEYFSREDVMSSVKNCLSLNQSPLKISNRGAQGVAELMVEVRGTFDRPLDEETLLQWHATLLATDLSIIPGRWRTGEEPMQVISGRIDNPTVHFEAPPSSRIPQEMTKFIKWFNDTSPQGDCPILHPVVRAGIAHLYFETIHPFEDGNGRIGRALAEKAISQTIGRPALITLSRTIEASKKSYYAALQSAQGSNEITPWLIYFSKTALDAQRDAKDQIHFVLLKTKFFDRYRDDLNDRKSKALKRMFESGTAGFEGGMTARKYTAITKTTKATATRDLQQLAKLGALIQIGGGRSTRYELNLDS